MAETARSVSRVRATRWCFTLNHWTPEEYNGLTILGNAPDTTYAVYGKEIGSNLTPHIQGFIIFQASRRFANVRSLLPRAHIEQARGTSRQAAEYCKKDGDYEEFGTFPGSSGRRSDLDDQLEWLRGFYEEHGRAPSDQEIALFQPAAFLRYRQNFSALARYRAPPPVLREGALRDWQIAAAARLDAEPDDRTIEFFIDIEGGKGKSWFQGWYLTNHTSRTQLLGVGKRDDVIYAIDETKEVFLFNIPRLQMQYVQFTVFEQLKDRVLFATKYQSCTKILPKTPHVMVFANEMPSADQKQAMSSDRWIFHIL